MGSTARPGRELEVTFRAAGEETFVTILHSGWERLGASAKARRDGNRAGWAAVNEAYARACAFADRA